MVLGCICGALWVIMVIVAYTFAKKAGEKEWGQFIAMNLIPIVGAVISILIYAIEIAKQEGKKNVQ